MNKRIIFCLLFLAAFSTFMSCKKDSTIDPADPRTQYVGSWLVQENKKAQTYEVAISNDPGNSAQVLISNFGNLSITPTALVTTGTITVATQKFNGNSLTVYGSGTYASNKITWTYYTNDGANLDTIKAVYTKK